MVCGRVLTGRRQRLWVTGSPLGAWRRLRARGQLGAVGRIDRRFYVISGDTCVLLCVRRRWRRWRREQDSEVRMNGGRLSVDGITYLHGTHVAFDFSGTLAGLRLLQPPTEHAALRLFLLV